MSPLRTTWLTPSPSSWLESSTKSRANDLGSFFSPLQTPRFEGECWNDWTFKFGHFLATLIENGWYNLQQQSTYHLGTFGYHLESFGIIWSTFGLIWSTFGQWTLHK